MAPELERWLNGLEKIGELATLAEDQSLVPTTHIWQLIILYISSSGDLTPSSGFHGPWIHVVHMRTCRHLCIPREQK